MATTEQLTDSTPLSKRKTLGALYDQINDTATPGDVLFFISKLSPPEQLSFKRLVYRNWVGFDPLDQTTWHTAIYVGPVKESRGRQFRPHVVHSIVTGTKEIHVPPEYFVPTEDKPGVIQRGRIEILHNPDVDTQSREQIVTYVRNKIGMPSDNEQGWRQDWRTYVLGLLGAAQDQTKISCHGLAFNAYDHIGLTFPHQLESAPNLFGRVLGHPVGHPAHHVDLAYNYLRDHHLYRDPRFFVALAVIGGECLREARVQLNPGKYSWDARLAENRTSFSKLISFVRLLKSRYFSS